MPSHIDTVQAMFQAFQRGDVPSIIQHLSPQVQWEAWDDNSAQHAGHPLMKRRHGPQEAAGFFDDLAAMLEIHRFEVLDVFGSGRKVAAETVIECTYRRTGQRIRDEILDLFSFDDAGKVVRVRQYLDTFKHLQALGVEPL